MKMYEIESVNILGVPYKLEFVPYIEIEDELSQNTGLNLELQGLCDTDDKIIYINNTISEKQQIITMRHELIHSFLYESGLNSCSLSTVGGWAVNEEMVDFFALQWVKINKVFNELGLVE